MIDTIASVGLLILLSFVFVISQAGRSAQFDFSFLFLFSDLMFDCACLNYDQKLISVSSFQFQFLFSMLNTYLDLVV